IDRSASFLRAVQDRARGALARSERFDVVRVVRSCCTLESRVLKDKKIPLEFDSTLDVVYLKGDPNALYDLLVNLIRNAADASAAFTVLAVRPASGQDLVVDTTGAGALIDEALDRSEVMQNLQYLSDVIGPRLTGSPAARRANDWTLERFRTYGLDAHLEPWQFGRTWTRGPTPAPLTAPRPPDGI